MTDPACAEQVWLPMALCSFKLLALGDALEQDTSQPLWGSTVPAPPRRRTIRLVRLAWLAIHAAQAARRSPPHRIAISPDPWPDLPLPAAMHHSTPKAAA